MNATPQIPLNMGVNKVQAGDQFVVVLNLNCGTLTVQLMLPPAAARALAKEISKWADDADKSIVLPFGARPGIPPD